jgi:hypothetical protein
VYVNRSKLNTPAKLMGKMRAQMNAAQIFFAFAEGRSLRLASSDTFGVFVFAAYAMPRSAVHRI